MTYEIEIGRGKRGRRAYSLDDIAIVPNRRTRDPKDVSVSWQIDAYKFDTPRYCGSHGLRHVPGYCHRFWSPRRLGRP